MSGIAGIIHFDGTPVVAGQVESMTNAMVYRGPDGIHHWTRGAVALGQCMLCTTTESLEETQPLANEDASLVLVMDGRVDNGDELRRKLLSHGTVLRDRSDAELVLRSFELWNRDCLTHIDGDFALAIWNARKQELFCARDRIGNKPFHYHWNDTTLAFASELHPVLGLPWVSETPNEDMLAEFLAAEWHARDETLWRGILRLVAAHRMIVDKNGPRIDRYWEPDLWATLAFTSDQEYINHYRELLGDCVRRMARSHRPLACEVSGGLDSSAIFAVAEQLRRNACLPAPGISGYTLAFAEDGEANELAHARAVGAHLGVRIDEIPPSIQPLSWFADVAHSGRDFPGFPNAAMFAGIRQRAVSDGSRVLLTGEGGDEWLQGSRAYYAEELAQRHWRALRDCFRTDAAAFGKAQAMRLLLRHGVLPLLPSGFESGLRRFVHAIRRNGSPDAYWLAPGMHARLESRRRQSGEGQPHRVRSAGQHDLLACLNDAFSDQVMENAERLAARAGIELRYPLRDHRLIQFAFSTPERLRLRGDRSKYLHVQAMQGLLPPSILERTDKAGFSTVFREPLQGMREMLTHAIPARRLDWVTADGMARLYAACQADHQPGWPLWSLWSVYGCDTIHIQI